MRKNYQNREIDTNQPTVSETVSVALDELAADMREGLLALAVGAGLQVMAAIMEQDVAAACGPRGRHDPQRTATRHGHERGSVTLGGRRVAVTRPRMRATDGSGELPVPAYELFSGTEVLGRMAMERMLACRPGTTRAGWNRSAPAPSRPRPPRRARRCRGRPVRHPTAVGHTAANQCYESDHRLRLNGGAVVGRVRIPEFAGKAGRCVAARKEFASCRQARLRGRSTGLPSRS